MNGRTVRGGRLTRKGAAEVLGVSVGTVRRLEGGVLHPIVDPSGVHLFDVAEVENAAREIFRPMPASASDPFAENEAALQGLDRRVAELERHVAELRRAYWRE